MVSFNGHGVSTCKRGQGGPRLRIEETRGRKSLQVQENKSKKEIPKYNRLDRAPKYQELAENRVSRLAWKPVSGTHGHGP